MRVPFHKQQLDFTCGPACLIMAMAAHDPAHPRTLSEEVAIWREATLAAVPATSRFGLALAAYRRGFHVRVVSATGKLPFRKRVEARMPDFYEGNALDVLWDDMAARFRDADIREEVGDVTLTHLDRAMDAGEVPILLTSTRHFGDADGSPDPSSPSPSAAGPDEDIPHWVVVAERSDDGFIVLNPLEEAPSTLHVSRDKVADAIGFEGDQELVIVGPRRA